MARRKLKEPSSKIFLVLVLTALGVNGLIFFIFGRSPAKPNTTAQGPVPAYFPSAEAAQPLPPTLDPGQFSNKYVVAAYEAAKEIPEVLAQQPCYCHCDRRGHRGLLDCFATKHGSDCDICVREALFALQEHRNGKTAEQIRTEINQGQWKTVQVQSS